MAKRRQHDAIIAAGVILTGGVYQYEYIASTVIMSLMDLQLEFETPIISALFTPLEGNDPDAQEFFLAHAELKGKEAATACRQLIPLMRDRKSSPKRARPTNLMRQVS